LRMPVLAIGGDHSYGAAMKTEVEAIASNVQGVVITNSGHWIMEEQPQQAIEALPSESAGAGTSGLQAVTTRVLFGDPTKSGLYTIELRVAPNTVIQA